MSVRYQKRKALGRNTNLNLSGSGASVSRRMGRVTVSSRGNTSIRLLPGFSYRMGKNSGAAGLVVLLIVGALWLCWVLIRLAWLCVWLPLKWVFGLLASRGTVSSEAGHDPSPPAH